MFSHAMNIHLIGAVALFSTAYSFIVWEKIDKTLVALLGAALLIALRVVPAESLIKYIDVNVIFLLIFMMIIVKITEKSGLFEWVAIWSAKKVKAKPVLIMVSLGFITAVASALLDNVTTILLITPITILITSELGVDAIPFLITQVLASNIGGTATLIGDPPNIMIGSAAHISFSEFAVNLGPVILIQMVVISGILFLLFRKRLTASSINRARVMGMNENKLIKNRSLLIKSLCVLGFVITGFVLHGALHLEASIVAMIGAIILIIWTGVNPEELFEKVEWSTILFFVGLFIMVGGLVEVGFVKNIAALMMKFSHNDPLQTERLILFSSALFSGVINNVPFVATYIPVIKEMALVMGPHNVYPSWWALACGACLGGNLTAVGASANVIMISIARKNGISISFGKFMLYGIPITVLSILIAAVYIEMRYF